MYDGKFLVRFDDTNPSKEKVRCRDLLQLPSPGADGSRLVIRMSRRSSGIRADSGPLSLAQAEFEQSIVEDLALLGIKADATSYTSDYFDQLQQYAIQLIKDGKAYADDTEQEVVSLQPVDSDRFVRSPRMLTITLSCRCETSG